MRALQPRAWLSGLGQASRTPWRHESLTHVSGSTQINAEAEAKLADHAAQEAADIQRLQLICKNYVPVNADSTTSRPILANLPGASELMEGAVPQSPTPQPLYDLPNFLANTYPHAGVHPRNPAYDWRAWAAQHLTLVPATSAATTSGLTSSINHTCSGKVTKRDLDPAAQIELFQALEGHLQQPASRATLVKIAKLELAHLWHYQLQHRHPNQRHQGQGQQVPRGAAVPDAASPYTPQQGHATQQDTSGASSPGAHTPGAASAATSPADPAATASAAPSPSQDTTGAEGQQEGVAGVATAGPTAAAVGGDDDEDIFAAADRKARERAAASAAAAAQVMQLARGKKAAAAAAEASKNPLSVLSPQQLMRLRELQRRAEDAGVRGGSLVEVLRQVAKSFQSHVLPSGGGKGGKSEAGSKNISRVVASAVRSGGSRTSDTKKKPTADEVLQSAITRQAGHTNLSYWASHPLLSYTENSMALALRNAVQRRQQAAAPKDGRASLSATVTALSDPSSGPPATPVLALLMDYLTVKYQDLLKAWEVAARLRAATEAAAAAAQRAEEQRRATIPVAADLLPPALMDDLRSSWPATGAPSADKATTAPLDWERANQILTDALARCTTTADGSGSRTTAAAAAAAAAAASGGDLRGAAEAAMAPLLAAAAARHRVLLGGGGVGAAIAPGAASAAALESSSSATTTATTSTSSATVSTAVGSSVSDRDVTSGGAAVVCFRETLVLDASSGFEDGSHDCRVTLEFSPDRLASTEPSLGGLWGARFLTRLMSGPMWPSPPDSQGASEHRGGSMAFRRPRSASARSAAMAAAFPPDVVRSYCPRTRTAFLTANRYPTREANRKLLLEHYASLLAVTCQAAQGAGVGAASSASATSS